MLLIDVEGVGRFVGRTTPESLSTLTGGSLNRSGEVGTSTLGLSIVLWEVGLESDDKYSLHSLMCR